MADNEPIEQQVVPEGGAPVEVDVDDTPAEEDAHVEEDGSTHVEAHVNEVERAYSNEEQLICKMATYNSTLDKAAQFPIGLLKSIVQSKNYVAHRFVIVDNSSSTTYRDCHHLVGSGSKTKIELCSRWEEISSAAKSIAHLADASETPAEFRLLNLNKQKVVVVGQSNDGGESLARAIVLLSEAPRADSPICKAVNEVVIKMRAMEDELRESGKKALLIILTDGASTDGDVVAALKQLEVLDEIEHEGVQIEEVNSWLTYGPALHRAREYGAVLPFLDNVDYCQLSQEEIKSTLQMLVFDNELAKEDQDWASYVEGVKAAIIPKVFCVSTKNCRPWVDVKALEDYKLDTLQAVLDRNEEVLRKIYITYAFDRTLMPQEKLVDCKTLGIVPNYLIRSVRVSTDKTVRTGENYTPMYARGQVADPKYKGSDEQISRYNTRFEKKDMHEDVFLKLLGDFDLVPAVINKVRFEKFMAAISEKRKYYTVRVKTTIAFKDFKKTLVKISQVNFPKYSKPKKLLVVLQKMSASGQLAKLEKMNKIVLREDDSAPFSWPITAADTAAAEE